MVVAVISQGASLVTALVGAVIFKLSVTGDYDNYVKANMRIPLILSALVLLGLGIPGVYRAVKGKGHTPGVSYVLLAPVVALLVVAPGPLSAFSADRVAAAPAPQAAGNGKIVLPKLPAGAVVPLNLTEYQDRARYEGRSLEGRKVELLGFVMKDDKGWYVARLRLNCCAADASGTKVRVEGSTAAPATESWVKVVGTWKDPGGAYPRQGVSVVTAESVTTVPTPDVPYEE